MTKNKSLSKYLYYNLKNIPSLDENGCPINGVRLDIEDYKNGVITLLRFKDGYLDGDVYNKDGSLRIQLPAVESAHHIEYWRDNKLHRDNGLPAVISGDPAKEEFWVNGVRQEKDKQS